MAAMLAPSAEQSSRGFPEQRGSSFETLLVAISQEHLRLRARATSLEKELRANRRAGQADTHKLVSPLGSEDPQDSELPQALGVAGGGSNNTERRPDQEEERHPSHPSQEYPHSENYGGSEASSRRIPLPQVPNPVASASRFAVDDFAADGNVQQTRSQSSLFAAFGGNKGLLQRCVGSPLFELGSGLIILLSAFVLGLETNYMAVHRGETHDTYATLNVLLNLFFVFEFAVRVVAEGPKFFCSRDWRWNYGDTFLVACCLVDLCIAFVRINFLVVGRVLRLLRLLRLVRTVRLVRAMRVVREFHKMMYAILSSLRTLVCSLAILTFVIYFFAVLMCQGVIEQSLKPGGASPTLQDMYGSVGRSFFSLFAAASTGIDWADTFRPLEPMHPLYKICFLSYIGLILFGVSNVVTSVFVESAIMSAQHYRDLIVDERLHAKQVAVMHMKEIFRTIDQDGSGEISGDEMEYFLTEPNLRSYVESLGISAENARMLFRLLDSDGSGKIDLDEFCDGCLRLQGEAKSMDVHTMIYQVRNFLAKWSEFTMFVEERFALLDLHPTPVGAKALQLPAAQKATGKKVMGKKGSMDSQNAGPKSTRNSLILPTPLVATPRPSSTAIPPVVETVNDAAWF